MAEPAKKRKSERRPYELATDVQLVARLRADDRRAFHEFYQRLAPALHAQARRLGVPREDRWLVVTGLLDDLVLRLTRFRMPVRKSLEDLAMVALRSAVFQARRKDERQRRLEREHATELEENWQSVVASCVSEATIRAALDPLVALIVAEEQASETDDPLRRLARALIAELDLNQVRLLEWSWEGVAQRTMAEWLGTTHTAVRTRLSRLRADLRIAATVWAAGLEGAERARLDRFLARAASADARIPQATPPERQADDGEAPTDDAA